MKCLFFLYGEYRTFPTAVKTWNILDIPNLDIVIHTPTTSSDFRFNTDFIEIVEDDFNVLKNPKIFFYDRDDFKKTDKHLLHFSYRFLSEYLESTDKNYDYIFIGRLDSEFYLEDYLDFISTKRDEIYAIDIPYITEDNCFIPDHIFFGSGEVIKKFVDNLPDREYLDKSHSGMAKYIDSSFECKTWKSFDSVHIRPNMVHLFETYFKNNSQIQNIDTSYSNFLKNEFMPNHVRLEEKYYQNYRNLHRVLVIGETCDDVFIYGEVSRLNPEAPVPIIKPKYEVINKGMAENVSKNLHSLDVGVDLISNTQTIKKIRYVDDSYNYILLRIDEGDSCERINLNDLPSDEYSAIVIGDYNKGFLQPDDIVEITKKYSCPIFLDTKKDLDEWVNCVDYIKINNSEYQRNKELIDNKLSSKTIVTRGREGCNFDGRNFPTKEVEVKDVVGAGDTFLAGLVFKYIETNSIEESIEFANLCSTQVVQKRGVGIVNKDELYGKK